LARTVSDHIHSGIMKSSSVKTIFLDRCRSLIWHEDEPIVAIDVSLYFVARLARDRVTVV